MAAFRRLTPAQLQGLTDEELIDYLDRAREAGDASAQREAIGYLAYSFEGIIKARVTAAVPKREVEDVTGEVMHSLVRAAFDGKLIGQFGAFVRTITKRRIADFHRDRKRRPRTDSLAEEHEGDGEISGGRAQVDDELGAADLRDVIGRLLATRNPLHQKVIRLYGPGVAGFENLSAEEVCDRIAADGSGDAMSVDNVAKIWSRFKGDLRRQLDD